MRQLHLPALLGLLRRVLLLRLQLPDVQPRRLLMRFMRGLVRQLQLLGLHVPHV
ncbi:hypothetical protein [Kibdelosporangium aridum]|uniref:hypothetical protein n=1 Tax=Kibdelosporangium aridum TaxID=2030 RepID=UPI00163BCD3B|nr:hypothetical protein [Kibdelosporangium aridum]